MEHIKLANRATSEDVDKQLKAEAHRLLDAAMQGLPTPAYKITEALHITGDI